MPFILTYSASHAKWLLLRHTSPSSNFFSFFFLFTKKKFILFSTYFLVSAKMSVLVTEMWSTKPPRNIEILWELKTNQHDPIRHIECVDFNLKCKILRSKPDNCLMKTTVHVFVRCLSYQYSFKILTRKRFQKEAKKKTKKNKWQSVNMS